MCMNANKTMILIVDFRIQAVLLLFKNHSRKDLTFEEQNIRNDMIFFSWQLCQRKLLHNLIRNKQEKIRA